MGLALCRFPRQAILTRLRRRNHSSVQARCGTPLPSQNRRKRNQPLIGPREEADRAIALDPRDAAAHLLKSLALEFQMEAKTAYEPALRIDDSLKPAREALERLSGSW